ncbi:MAG: recombinase family protein [Oscillospiraceae bacterium]|nr:recombinase family protein [Oscillospiraceae bacterium]
METKPLKLIYLRKSRADGENETVSDVLARHERILQEFAGRAFGEPIPEEQIFREIVSGETIAARPEMCRLLETLQDREIEMVLVVDPQRLSRGDLRDCGTVIRAFQYTGTLVATPQKTYDLRDKFDRKFLEMELMRGNDYLEYVKEILHRGRLASVAEGNFVGSVPPFGYQKVRAGKGFTLSENEESDIVRLIFSLYVQEDLGISAICSRLNAMCIRPRKKAYWVPSSLREILCNPVYIGKIRYDRRKTVKQYDHGEIIKTRPQAPPEQCILTDGKHPALIPEEVFAAAQQKQGHSPRRKPHTALCNPFAGLCRCACGAAMVLKKSRHAQPRLVCTQQTHCRNRSVTLEDYTEAVIQILPQIVANIAADEIPDESKAKRYSRLQKSAEQELHKISQQQERLYELLETGTYTEELFLERAAALDKRRNAAESALREAQTQAGSQQEQPQERRLTFQQAIHCIRREDIPAQAKNAFLRSILQEIRYTHAPDEEAFRLDLFLRI